MQGCHHEQHQETCEQTPRAFTPELLTTRTIVVAWLGLERGDPELVMTIMTLTMVSGIRVVVNWDVFLSALLTFHCDLWDCGGEYG